MVYESDFYTTRRPYSRPLVSSYTVTYRPIIIPLSSTIQLRSVPYIPYMPYVAHKRLVTVVHTPIHTPIHVPIHTPVHRYYYYAGTMVPVRVRARVRPSVLAAELNRIRDLPRPTSRSYLDEYLNSRFNIYFDDETRDIRAKVDSLLRRVHVFVPRTTASEFAEEIVPERMRSHDYVRRLLTGRNNAKKNIEHLGWYEIPERGTFGTLACIKYIAGNPQSVRKPYFKVADLRPSDIRTDVTFLSYYSKNRQAAATAFHGQPMTEREMRKARALAIEPSDREQKPTAAPISKEEEEEEPEKRARKKSEPREVPEPETTVESEPEPIKEPEPEEPKPAREPEPAVAESAKPSKAAKGTRAARLAAKAAKAKAEPEPEPEPTPVSEPEPVPESEPEPIAEAAADEPIVETASAEAVSDVAKEEEKEEEEEEEEDENVRQQKLDALKRAEEYLAKVAREAQTEEERQKVAEEERVQLEMEEKKAWEALQLAQERKAELSDILETERQEAERKTEEAKLQAEREETERIEEGERLINQEKLDALIQEQERMIIEEHLEEIQNQKQEQEEADVAPLAAGELKDVSCAEDPMEPDDITDQEREEKPCDVTTDDETRVEEENVPEEVHEAADQPFVEEPEGAESKPQTGPMATEDEAQAEEVEEFDWGDQDS